MILLYLLSGVLFGLGLSLSGMVDPHKVLDFLAIGTSQWNPALLFVLASAVLVYGAAFFVMRRRKKTIGGQEFVYPLKRSMDRRVVLGSILFGLGWGLVGVCPGPALAHIAYLDSRFAIFILAMYLGFFYKEKFFATK